MPITMPSFVIGAAFATLAGSKIIESMNAGVVDDSIRYLNVILGHDSGKM
jgi:hypothetical protein